MRALPTYLDAAVQALGLISALVLWEAAVRFWHANANVLPAPSTILTSLWTSRAILAQAVAVTMYEAVAGLAGAIVIGVMSGIAFSHFRMLERMFLPYFVASQAVPIIAFGAIIVMWFGNGVASKAFIALYLSFFPIAVNTLIGIRSVDAGEIGLLRSFGAGRGTILRKLQLPAALPFIFTAIRLGASLALVGAIVGEWFGASRGLGVVLLNAMFEYRITQLWAGILLTGLAGVLLFRVVAFLQSRIAWWHVET